MSVCRDGSSRCAMSLARLVRFDWIKLREIGLLAEAPVAMIPHASTKPISPEWINWPIGSAGASGRAGGRRAILQKLLRKAEQALIFSDHIDGEHGGGDVPPCLRARPRGDRLEARQRWPPARAGGLVRAPVCRPDLPRGSPSTLPPGLPKRTPPFLKTRLRQGARRRTDSIRPAIMGSFVCDKRPSDWTGLG
jgi:hypothetical protein